MKNPTAYLKMRVLGAIDMAEGHCIQARIKAVALTTFTDEYGQTRQFTWRTIQTWYSHYKKHGVTALSNTTRVDKGKIRRVSPEVLLEAIRTVLPKMHGPNPKRATLYRLCIEQGGRSNGNSGLPPTSSCKMDFSMRSDENWFRLINIFLQIPLFTTMSEKIFYVLAYALL
jgi:hypothetical protein